MDTHKKTNEILERLFAHRIIQLEEALSQLKAVHKEIIEAKEKARREEERLEADARLVEELKEKDPKPKE